MLKDNNEGVTFIVENNTLTIDLGSLRSILERSHPKTHCLIKQGIKYLECGKDADDAALNSINTDIGTYGAMIQSWAVIFLPHESVFLLRNAFGIYLGWESGTYRVDSSHAMENDDSFLWKIEQVPAESTFYIKSNTGGKYLTSDANTLKLNNVASPEAKWNFEISTTVPPGW